MVFCFPAGTASGRAEKDLSRTIRQQQGGIADRHLTLIDVSAEPVEVKGAEVLPAEEAAVLRRRLKLDESKAVFVLIGKDGGEKARQNGRIDLGRFFAFIDTMPMRRAEMREKRN